MVRGLLLAGFETAILQCTALHKPRRHRASNYRTQLALRSVRFWLPVILASTALGQDPATVGQWSAVMSWPYLAVHAHVLPTGKVLWWTSFSQGDNPQLWNPTTNVVTAGPKAG